MAVALGADHGIVVGESGDVFTWGMNSRGQLGTGDKNSRAIPTRVVGLPAPVRQVAAGGEHTGIVTQTGELFMCGDGRGGKVGTGELQDRTTPTLLARVLFEGEAVLMVACGCDHTMVVTEGGKVFTFGSGSFGQLGHGDLNQQLTPKQVPVEAFNGEQIVMVAGGFVHSIALSAAGNVFTWGHNATGQLGHNNLQSETVPRQVDTAWFDEKKVAYVAAGFQYSVAVTVEGQLYTWGMGSDGRLGHGDDNDRLVPTLVRWPIDPAFGVSDSNTVVMATATSQDSHTLAMTRDGALWACGRGGAGQLGLNDRNSRRAFERIGGDMDDGTGVVAVATGWAHSAAVTEDGTLWTWGSNEKLGLGHGYGERRLLPTPVTMSPLRFMRVRRLLPLPPENALAFAMSQQKRVGATSAPRVLKTELLKMIVDAASLICGLDRTRHQAVITLLGGYRALNT